MRWPFLTGVYDTPTIITGLYIYSPGGVIIVGVLHTPAKNGQCMYALYCYVCNKIRSFTYSNL